MSEYRFSLTCIFHYKGRIFDSQVAAKPSLYVYIYEVLSIAPISCLYCQMENRAPVS